MRRIWLAMVLLVSLSLSVWPAGEALGACDRDERRCLKPVPVGETEDTRMWCDDGTVAQFVVNGQPLCELDPRPYRVRVPGGERTLVGLRTITQALAYRGMTAAVDWWQEPDGLYVAAGNRHREILLRIGDHRMRRWTVSDDGSRTELAPVTLDAAPELFQDRTMVPFRAVLEALGGSITAVDPQIVVTYADEPTAGDFRTSEAAAPGARSAYTSGLITLSDLFFLVDLQRFHLAETVEGNTNWAAKIPVAYIRFAVLHDTIVKGRTLTDQEYEWVGASAAPMVGRVFSGADSRKIGRLAEEAIDIVAQKEKWAEAGRDPLTNRWVDFSDYNRVKRANSDLNGPDRMYVIADKTAKILLYIAPESKGTLRPWVSPSRFAENVPFWRQVDNLSRWSDPAVSVPFQTMRQNLNDYYQLMEAGQLSLEEFQALVAPMRVTTSPLGGSTAAARTQMEAEGIPHASLNWEREIIGANLPRITPPGEE